MGQGEYGGNGSVHWYGVHRTDRNHGRAAHSFHEVDENPGQGGDFIVTIFDVNEAAINYDRLARTLTARVRIKHGAFYTEQILITWPPDPHRPGIQIPDPGTAEPPAGGQTV